MFLAPPPYYAPDGNIFLIDYFLPVKFAPLCLTISRENTNYWCFTRSFGNPNGNAVKILIDPMMGSPDNP